MPVSILFRNWHQASVQVLQLFCLGLAELGNVLLADVPQGVTDLLGQYSPANGR